MIKLKFIKGKKGAESEMWPLSDMLFFILFGGFVGIAAILFVIFVSTPEAGKAQIKYDLESYFLIDRLLKSPTCFAFYDDSINLVYAGYLDHSKFTSSQLSKCFGELGKDDVAFRITLSSSAISELPKTIKTSNWNDNKPIEKKEQKKNVVVIYQNNKFNGEMSIELQNLK